MTSKEIGQLAARLCMIEENALDLRKALCTGSMLKGWYLRDGNDVDYENEIRPLLAAIIKAAADIK